MVDHLPMKKFAIYAVDRWNNNLIMCWSNRDELELLREASSRELAIAPVITMLKHTSEFDPEHSHRWRYVPSQRALEKSNINDLDQEFAVFSDRAQQWVKGLSKISGIINFFRAKYNHDLWHKQSQVYSEKLSEARRVTQGNYDDLIFLPLESEERQMSISELATEILLAHRLDTAVLAKTEAMRVRWMLRYRRLLDSEQKISDFIEQIHKEAYDHQRS